MCAAGGADAPPPPLASPVGDEGRGKTRRGNAPYDMYAVVRGRGGPGLYRTWAETEARTRGFRGAMFQGFRVRVEAERYLQDYGVPREGGVYPEGCFAEVIASRGEAVTAVAVPMAAGGSQGLESALAGLGNNLA